MADISFDDLVPQSSPDSLSFDDLLPPERDKSNVFREYATGLDDRGKTLIPDTGIAPIDFITEKAGQLGYAVADNIIGFDDGVDTLGERLGEGVGNVALGVGSGATKAIEGAFTTAALVPDALSWEQSTVMQLPKVRNLSETLLI